jgi:5'-3' exonuclease
MNHCPLKIFCVPIEFSLEDSYPIHMQVRLGTAGWKERYYKEKFSAKSWRDIEILRKELVSFC